MNKKKTTLKHSVETWIDYCFPDDVLATPAVLNRFLDKYVNHAAGSIWAKLCIEDDNLVIDISTGFHCLHIPLKAIEQVIEKAKEDTQ